MPKVKKDVIELRGTFGNITFVDSPTYGMHVRAKRGTYKKAVLNAACKKQSKKLQKVNLVAKVIKEAIDPYREDFYDGSMWPRLVSLINKNAGDDGAFDISNLRSFDLFPRYSFTKLTNPELRVRFDEKGRQLLVDVGYKVRHPSFRSSNINGYQFSVIGVFCDLVKKRFESVAERSSVISLDDSPAPVRLKLHVPAKYKTFFLCLRLDGCLNGEPEGSRESRAMCIVQTGRF